MLYSKVYFKKKKAIPQDFRFLRRGEVITERDGGLIRQDMAASEYHQPTVFIKHTLKDSPSSLAT